jgi:hypothetical protein
MTDTPIEISLILTDKSMIAYAGHRRLGRCQAVIHDHVMLQFTLSGQSLRGSAETYKARRHLLWTLISTTTVDLYSSIRSSSRRSRNNEFSSMAYI